MSGLFVCFSLPSGVRLTLFTRLKLASQESKMLSIDHPPRQARRATSNTRGATRLPLPPSTGEISAIVYPGQDILLEGGISEVRTEGVDPCGQLASHSHTKNPRPDFSEAGIVGEP